MSRLVSIDDLVDASAVASALGLSHRNSVTTYMRRYHDFPRPLFETGGGRVRLWSRREVDRWALARHTRGERR